MQAWYVEASSATGDNLAGWAAGTSRCLDELEQHLDSTSALTPSCTPKQTSSPHSTKLQNSRENQYDVQPGLNKLMQHHMASISSWSTDASGKGG